MAEKTFTAKDWDDVRVAFHTSIMVDTSLNSLAQNLDTADWPLKGPDETPAKYIDFTYDELLAQPAFAAVPERANHLISILRDTLAFDNPFGEMVQHEVAVETKDNQLLKNLAKLEISENFPVGLTQLSSETLEFCQRENLATLGQFAVFAQGLSQSVIVSGDFRKLLNAVAHVDEAALAELLPFRPGEGGLHLPEALGHAIRTMAPAARLAMLRKFGGRLTEAEAAEADGLSEEEAAAAEAALRARADRFFDCFSGELAEVKAQVAEGGSLERYLMVLNDAVAEALASVLLQPHVTPPPVEAPVPEKKGFFGSLARLFGKK
ncbi:MAG: hypothetical protein KGJ37_01390 [Verrucomicrobiota bacterium]|nr:hypothetical protein [Verrucomicrobiota bacterium]